MEYYDPMFYLCSEEMPFTIRIETKMTDEVRGEDLFAAMTEAFLRYPYFSVRVVERDGEYVLVHNDAPAAVYEGDGTVPLGSEKLGYHLTAIAYSGRMMHFCTSHVMTDGAGFFPFIKTVLYLYLCRRYGKTLDPAGIRLPSDPFYPDEIGNPFPEEKMLTAAPFYVDRHRPFFRLRGGGYVTDATPTMYRFRIGEKEFLDYNNDVDGSPCALVSSLMARAVWRLHPDVTDDIVSAVSFNLRPGLGNRASYRMLCSSINLHYRSSMRDFDITKLCTCSRGMTTMQTQPEDVLYCAEQRRRDMEKLLAVPGLQTKKEILSKKALADSVNNTFSVSYVGRVDFGSILPYVESMYNVTDGSTYKTVFIEVAAVNGYFNIAFLQGFSSDVYYRAFLHELDVCGIAYTEDGVSPMNAPKIELP